MASFYLFTATLQGATGMPDDRFVNTFAVRSNDALSAPERSAIMGGISDFYGATPTGGLVSVSTMISDTVLRDPDVNRIRCYDVSANLGGIPIAEGGVPAGSPIDEGPIDLDTAVNPLALPSEVAYVLTLEAANRALQPVEVADGADDGDELDRPRQRYTGRIYVGPLTSATVSMVDFVARPASNIRDTVALAAADLAEVIRAETGGTGANGWAVWSRSDATMRPIDHIAHDNSFDTQRRRGEGPTIRTRVAV